jgi:hypothetical protein
MESFEYIKFLFVVRARSIALIEAQKRYYEANKAKLNEYNRKRYEVNNDIKEKKKEYVRQWRSQSIKI